MVTIFTVVFIYILLVLKSIYRVCVDPSIIYSMSCKLLWSNHCCTVKQGFIYFILGPSNTNKTLPESSSAESSKASTSSNNSLPSFWIPSLTPEAEPTLLKKPVSNININNILPKAVATHYCYPGIHFQLIDIFLFKILTI